MGWLDVTGGASGSSGGDSSGSLGGVGRIRRLVRVLAGVEAEGRVVDAAQLPKEEEQEDGAGEDIEDTVPDHLGGD